MDLEKSINNRLKILLGNFLDEIADKYDIDSDELQKYVKTLNFDTNTVQTKMTCMHKMISGKNKGKYCTSKAMENGYCGRHQNSASTTVGRIATKNKKAGAQPKKMTKTQQDIIDWLNTAVPQQETVLSRTEHGLWHEDTDIIFDENFIAIGHLNNGKVVLLLHSDVEKCERMGWKYDPERVEDLDDDSE